MHMNNSDKVLVTRTPSTQLKKLLKLHGKKSNKWTMASFVHNGSEITTWMQCSFKTKSAKSKVIFSRFEPTYFWTFKLQIVRLAQGHQICMPIDFKITAFTADLCKNIFSSSFYQGVFFCKLLTEKLWVQCQSITSLLEIQSQFLFFYLDKIEMSKQYRFFIL